MSDPLASLLDSHAWLRAWFAWAGVATFVIASIVWLGLFVHARRWGLSATLWDWLAAAAVAMALPAVFASLLVGVDFLGEGSLIFFAVVSVVAAVFLVTSLAGYARMTRRLSRPVGHCPQCGGPLAIGMVACPYCGLAIPQARAPVARAASRRREVRPRANMSRRTEASEWARYSRALGGAQAVPPDDDLDPPMAELVEDLAIDGSDEPSPPASEDLPRTGMFRKTEGSEWTRFSRALGGAQAAPHGDEPDLHEERVSPGSARGLESDDEFYAADDPPALRDDGQPSPQIVQEDESELIVVSRARRATDASVPSANQPPDAWASRAPTGHPHLPTVPGINRLLQQLDPQVMAQDGDEVDCSVFAPPRTPAGNPLLVQVIAHLPEDVERARQLAEEFDTGAARRGLASLTVPIAGGALLGFELRMRDLRVDEPFQTARWRGRPALVQFVVDVPVEHRPGVAVGRILVSCDGLPVGSIAFRVDVLAADAHIANDLEPAGVSPRRYRQAFISYAAADRDEVLKRVQVLPRVGVRCFQDILELEPGQRWENQLYRLIDESDLFLLFWSSAAQSSEWVGREIDYALRRKDDDDDAPPEIVPVPIEGPPPILPPPQLAHLHFDDRTRYFMHRSP